MVESCVFYMQDRRNICLTHILKLRSADVDGLEAAVAVGDIKSNGLAVFQGLEAVGSDAGVVNEDVLAVLAVGDEAEALLRVKPFYCTFIHERYLLKYNIIFFDKTKKNHTFL